MELKTELLQRLFKALSLNSEEKASYCFYILNNCHKMDEDELRRNLIEGNFQYSMETITRTMRKLKEEFPQLRDSNWGKRQAHAKDFGLQVVKSIPNPMQESVF